MIYTVYPALSAVTMAVDETDDPVTDTKPAGLVQWKRSNFPWRHALIGPSYDY